MGINTNILPQVLTEIDKADKNGTLRWQEEDDVDFFQTAINKCFLNSDSKKAMTLYNILMRGSNRQYFTNYMDENRFLYGD